MNPLLESVAIELLRQALRLGGEAIYSILERGTTFNDAPIAERVRGILWEESESRRAANAIGGPDAPKD